MHVTAGSEVDPLSLDEVEAREVVVAAPADTGTPAAIDSRVAVPRPSPCSWHSTSAAASRCGMSLLGTAPGLSTAWATPSSWPAAGTGGSRRGRSRRAGRRAGRQDLRQRLDHPHPVAQRNDVAHRQDQGHVGLDAQDAPALRGVAAAVPGRVHADRDRHEVAVATG